MFGFLKRFFSPRPDQQAGQGESPPAPTAPGTLLHYDPELIERLTGDHRGLLDIYGRISNAHDNSEYGQVRELLAEFDHRLREHLLQENTRLYVYLQHNLPRGTEEWRTMHDFQHEMKDIGKAVTAFLDRYAIGEWDTALVESFSSELAGIGQVLQKRIEAEEERLYPQYAAPDT